MTIESTRFNDNYTSKSKELDNNFDEKNMIIEKQKISSETRESLDKQALINEAKTIIYEKLWINFNQNENSKLNNFLKWELILKIL